MQQTALRAAGDRQGVMQPTYYLAAGFDWQPGQTITNETFSSSPQKTFFTPTIPAEHTGNIDYLARRSVEQMLEEVRSQGYGSFPSREVAIFLNQDCDAAKRWTNRPARKGYHIYELEATRTVKAAAANYIWYNYCVRLRRDGTPQNRHLFSENLEEELQGAVHAYWQNRSTEEFGSPSQTEVLFAGELCVVRKVA